MTTDPIPPYADCPWPVDPACLGETWDDLDEEVRTRATLLAGSTLRRLTGYRVGGCPLTVRPCRQACTNTAVLPSYWMLGLGGGSGFFPHQNSMGVWINSCGCTTDCSCAELCEVALPGPVGKIFSVKVDGIEVDPTLYVRYDTKVVWAGQGDCEWPTCQDLTLPDTEPGTFSITYLNSYPVDGLGAYAAGVLAYEYAQACQGNSCRLPTNVTGMTRQGVTYEIAAGSFPGGFTGIREVDAYIALWNPQGLRQSTRVWSPDLHNTPRVQLGATDQ